MDEKSTDLSPVLYEQTLRPDQFPGRENRFAYFKNRIRPFVDPEKLLVYSASGFDLSVMMGSGVKKAMYVDPCYKKSVRDPFVQQNNERLGFNILVDLIKKIDKNPQITRFSSQAKIMGTIQFVVEGKVRTLHVIGEDWGNFINGAPRAAGLYVTIGDNRAELYLNPVTADNYVVCTYVPRSLGYSDIQVNAGTYTDEWLPLAKSFVRQNLTQNEESVLLSLGGERVIGVLASIAKKGSIDDVRRELVRGLHDQKTEGKTIEELAHMRYMKYWKKVQTLTPNAKARLLVDLRFYLDNIFTGLGPILASKLKRSIINTL